jgi:long-subunit acyl-CoA synthetase (AMP-forming)
LRASGRSDLEQLIIPGVLEALAGWPGGACIVADDRGDLTAGAFRAAIGAERLWLTGRAVERVALFADNGRAWAIADLALLDAGLVNVPIPHHFAAGQMRHALANAGVDGILTDDPAGVMALDLGYSRAAVSPGSGLWLLTPEVAPERPALPPGTVKVTYTSGSTAEPKGVCLSRATLDAVSQSVAAVGRELGIRRHLSLLPLATLLENVAGLYAAWLSGATAHLHAEVPAAIGQVALTGERLLTAIDRHQPESLILVPELLRMLVAGAETGWRVPAAAKFFAVGGACVSRKLLDRAASAGIPAYEGYGLSECGSVQCLNTRAAYRRGSVGRALPHARVRVDARGEVRIAGTVMSGYVGDAALPADAEIATGDLGEIDGDGFVYIKGRIKNLFINSFGRNLSPEWIERELVQETAIGQAIACGEGRPWVAALVNPSAPDVSRADLDAAVARANARLPHYAQVMRFAVPPESFTKANGLLTGNGRTCRERILERYGRLIDELYWQALAI